MVALSADLPAVRYLSGVVMTPSDIFADIFEGKVGASFLEFFERFSDGNVGLFKLSLTFYRFMTKPR